MTRITKSRSAIATLAILLLAGCATQSVPSERLNEVAVVTSGGTNLWTLGRMPTITIIEVDGATPANAYGPIELAPGPHKLKMKCGGNITETQVTVAARYMNSLLSWAGPAAAKAPFTGGDLQTNKHG